MKIEFSSSELELLHMVIENVTMLLRDEKKNLDSVTIVGMAELIETRAVHIEELETQIEALDALASKLPECPD